MVCYRPYWIEVKTNDGMPVIGKLSGTDPEEEPLMRTRPQGFEAQHDHHHADCNFTYVPKPGFHSPNYLEETVDNGHVGKTAVTVAMGVNSHPTVSLYKMMDNDPDGKPAGT